MVLCHGVILGDICPITLAPSFFFRVVIPVALDLFCSLIVENIVQDTTIQVKGSWRLLNYVNWYIKKEYFCFS